ncbi:MAG: hypothetical protein M1840_005718 [Geoglossum simile]|nr:MAG: hypothetical protein M1840_005718 [Geoglossum simile]
MQATNRHFRLQAGDVTWVLRERAGAPVIPKPIEQEPVYFEKVVTEDGDSTTALLTSINEIRRAEGKTLLNRRGVFSPVGGPPRNEEQLTQILKTLGDYRLAVIEPRLAFRARLAPGNAEEGALVYIHFDGRARWDGVRLISRYEPYPTIAGADFETEDCIQFAIKIFRNFISPEAYSDHQRNPQYLEVGVTRVRTWTGGEAGAAATVAVGKRRYQKLLRSVPRKRRAGRRGVLNLAALR